MLLEPNVKGIHGYKTWGFDKWQELASSLSHFKLLQIGSSSAYKKLHSLKEYGVRFEVTSKFRQALCFVKTVRGVITTEGGLHHAAGVLRTPAVVLFGGRTHPHTTGYDWHTNIYVDIDGSPCAGNGHCKHCRECLSKISVEHVRSRVNQLPKTIFLDTIK